MDKSYPSWNNVGLKNKYPYVLGTTNKTSRNITVNHYYKLIKTYIEWSDKIIYSIIIFFN